MKQLQKPEITAVVRDLETLEAALEAGADAIEIAGGDFGFLAASSRHFTLEEIAQAVKLTQEREARLYAAVNLLAHNRDIERLQEFLKELEELRPDAVIVADPGVLLTVKESAPSLTIHVNMEMTLTNWEAARFWMQAGAKRVVLARELNFDNIREICEHVSGEVESQVQGAMNIFYTGRPILSNYHEYRGGQWEIPEDEIQTFALKEERRTEDYYPVYEDERGTYVMNSADLCLIQHIPDLMQTGLSAYRIETRPHGSEYVKQVVSVYRQAVDRYLQNPENYQMNPEWLETIQKISDRPLTQGFYIREAAK